MISVILGASHAPDALDVYRGDAQPNREPGRANNRSFSNRWFGARLLRYSLALSTMSQYQLSEKLISLSIANTWDEAKLEWALEHVWREDDPDTCLCGRFPIIEICLLRNRKNNNSAIVGNCCVKKFETLPSDLIFQAVRRIQQDIARAINPETIDHAHQKRWINDWERKFYIDTWRKKKLSEAQHTKRIQINQKVLSCIVRARNNAKG